jgi:hypothetical protein
MAAAAAPIATVFDYSPADDGEIWHVYVSMWLRPCMAVRPANTIWST